MSVRAANEADDFIDNMNYNSRVSYT
jgi:hypothetical protein